MTDEVDWDQFGSGGDFPASFKFEEVGASIVGTITRTRVATMPTGDKIPELWIRTDNGEERSVLAGNVRLMVKLSELRPASGDRIAIVYTGVEASAKPGKSPAKVFDVQVQPGGGASSSTPAPAASTPAAAPAAQPASSLL